MLQYCPRKDIEVPDLREACRACPDNPCWWKKLKFREPDQNAEKAEKRGRPPR